MIIFFQTVENQQQRWIEGDLKDVDRIKVEAFHLSIYALSHLPDEEKRIVKYQGNLVFDIDNSLEDKSPDIEQSILDGVNLLNQLNVMGVPDDQLEIFASGKKGFHITVRGATFGGHRATENLPDYHKYMVSVISGRAGMKGTDLSLYNSGRGKLLRVENKARENGHYKVPITPQELRGLTAQGYEAITAQPRIRDWEIAKSTEADGMFEVYREGITAFEKPKVAAAGISSERMKELLGETPKCVQQTVLAENTRPTDGAFNKAKMSLARYLASTETPEAETLIETFAENWESSRHPTTRERVREVKSAIKCLEGKEFSCGLILSGLDIKPCKGCALNPKPAAQQEAAAFANQMEGSVFMGAGAYEKEVGNSSLVISNFTLEPVAIYYQEVHTDVIELITVKINVFNDPVSYTKQLSPLRFASKSEFKKSILGSGNANFYGGDNDPGFIYSLITEPSKIEDVPKMTQFSKVGIIHHVVPTRGIDEKVWVQDTWSVNPRGIQDTVTFKSAVVSKVEKEHKLTLDLSKTSERIDARSLTSFEALLDSRDAGSSASFLGFMAACWVKPILQGGVFSSTTFPVLQVYGEAGSGKSSLVRYWASIAGADVISGGAITLGMITPASLREETVMTTTVPRIVDEVNPAKSSKIKWDGMRDAIKNIATGQSASIMRKQPDGTMVNTKILSSSPLITMGVARIEEAEIEQRTEQIGLFLADTKNPMYRENFKVVRQDTGFLAVIAGAFMRETLIAPDEVLEDWQLKNFAFTEEFVRVERPAIIAAEILTGLDFAYHVIKTRADNPERVLEKILVLREAYIAKVRARQALSVDNSDEKEIFLSRLSVMAATYRDYKGEYALITGVHFVKTEVYLHIRPNAMLLHYRKFLREQDQKSEFATATSLIETLKSHKAFVGLGVAEDVLHRGDWLTLDLSLLAAGGLDISRFDR